ncbi:MAG: glycine C-acetyltransferase [Acidobacteriota bacterium]|jgi:glycine C-acetyltransferase|nr:glycine C-acetyltransferase [Acidobacteriota bacterium]
MYEQVKESFRKEVAEIHRVGLFKEERVILSEQQAGIRVQYPSGAEPRQVLNFCANNYLGLANHPRLIEAAADALKHYGFGMASVRFICGTQDIHTRLEERISAFHGTEDTILYSSCFDANGGLFETILGPEDAIISDALNHASIIDGIRLSKARRFVYPHSDMTSLENALCTAASASAGTPARRILIVTDGVFSMDGDIAPLDEIVTLAKRYGAMVMVDESHATGFFGPNGRGAAEYFGVLSEIDIITSTLGKAMGGASGGFTTGHRDIIALLRQKSRPYQFSNTLAPAIVNAAIAAFDLVESAGELRRRLMQNTARFRAGMQQMGFDINPGIHPIVPVLFRRYENDALMAQDFARRLYANGIYAVGFFFPVVPRGQARIRVQISAAHTTEHIDMAIEAFQRTGKEMGMI